MPGPVAHIRVVFLWAIWLGWQAELLKKAKMWIELDRKKALYVQLKNQKKELDKRRQEAEKSLEPYVRKVDELKQQMEDTKLAVNKVKVSS